MIASTSSTVVKARDYCAGGLKLNKVENNLYLEYGWDIRKSDNTNILPTIKLRNCSSADY